jgi:cytochrome c-type biogenesis protein
VSSPGLLDSLTGLLERSGPLSVLAAGAWGALSVILSPCHLAGVPLLVGFIADRRDPPRRRAFALSLVFAGGILLTIAGIGGLTGALGRLLGDTGITGRITVGVVLVAFGLYLMDLLPLPLAGLAGNTRWKRSGLLGALALGVVFGLALGPCTFAFMAPVLALALGAAATAPALTAALILAFAAGHCAVIVAAGTFAGLVGRFLRWNERSTVLTWVRRGCGALLVVGAAYLVLRA